MKAQSNISSDGGFAVSCGKPPAVSNTHLTPPHITDLLLLRGKDPSFKWGWRTSLIGLLSAGMISALLTENLLFLCATFKDIQMDYDLIVDKNYGNMGQKWNWGMWVKRREADKSLINLFTFHCPVFGKGFSPQGNWGGRSRHRWCGLLREYASSKITQFKYFSRNSNANNYPAVTVKPV